MVKPMKIELIDGVYRFNTPCLLAAGLRAAWYFAESGDPAYIGLVQLFTASRKRGKHNPALSGITVNR